MEDGLGVNFSLEHSYSQCSLNPYFNGRRFGSNYTIGYIYDGGGVLILILMEDGLGVRFFGF